MDLMVAYEYVSLCLSTAGLIGQRLPAGNATPRRISLTGGGFCWKKAGCKVHR